MKVDWREIPGRYVKDPRLGHRLGRNHPAGEVSDPIWNIKWLGTDKLGLVYNESPERDFELSDTHVKKIFLLGGSTLMGLGVAKNSDTIASALERYLRKQIPNARTVNCGVGSYVSWQSMMYLALELIEYKPDIIVTFDGWNDFLSSSWGNKNNYGNWVPNTHRSLDDINALIQTSSADITLFELLKRKFYKTELVRQIRMRSKYYRESGSWVFPDYREWTLKPESAEYYRLNIQSIIGMGIASGAKVLSFLQPQLMWGNRTPTTEEQAYIEKIGTRLPPTGTLAAQWFPLGQKKFSELKVKLHNGKRVWVEDASGWFDGNTTTLYSDYNHYNQEGQRLIAELIANRIEAILAAT